MNCLIFKCSFSPLVSVCDQHSFSIHCDLRVLLMQFQFLDFKDECFVIQLMSTLENVPFAGEEYVPDFGVISLSLFFC